MKKQIIMILIIFCLIEISYSQEKKAKSEVRKFEKKYSIGFKTGTGVGFIGWNQYIKNKYSWNIVDWSKNTRAVSTVDLGMLIDLELFRKNIIAFDVQMELKYARFGGEIAYKKVEYHGGNLPIYLKSKFTVGKGDIYFLCGVDNFFGLEIIQNIAANIDLKSHNYLVGLALGFGYDIWYGPGKFEIGLLYKYNTIIGDIVDLDYHTVNFEFGYAFFLK